eukprot:9283094-Pyramimonas_sp.AAC.1
MCFGNFTWPLGARPVQTRLGARVSPPLQVLKHSMIRQDNKGPKMKTKAAEGRHLLVVLQHMLQSFHYPVNDHDRLRAQCTDAIVNLYNELEHWDPDTSIDKIRVFSIQFVTLYCELFRESCARDSETVFWKVTPKFHLLLHVCEIHAIERGNPREMWNYGDESAIGEAADLAKSCHARTISTEVLRKHRATVALVDADSEAPPPKKCRVAGVV